MAIHSSRHGFNLNLLVGILLALFSEFPPTACFLLVRVPVVVMNQSPQSVAVESFESRSGIGKGRRKMSPASEDNDLVTNVDKGATHKLDNNNDDIHYVRSLVFELAALVGELSSTFLKKVPLDPPFVPLDHVGQTDKTPSSSSAEDKDGISISRSNAIEDDEVSRAIAKVLLKLIELAHSLSLKLGNAIVRKMKLNEMKYPAELCRGKAGKYTDYSALTGITKDKGQSTLHMEVNDDEETVQSFLDSLESLTQEIGNFATARLWSRYHKPRNLCLALLGEFGEVSLTFVSVFAGHVP